LEDLGLPLSEDEILKDVADFPSDKTPGPCGFTTEFFHSCWPIIKDDLMNVINALLDLSINNMYITNMDSIALLPKNDGADSISEFGPISLISYHPKDHRQDYDVAALPQDERHHLL
jgi:hypothetical protein